MKFNPNARLDTSQVQDRRGGGGGGGRSGGFGGMPSMPGGKGGIAVGGGGLGLLIVVGIILFNVFSGGGSSSTGSAGMLAGAGANTAVDNGQLATECQTGADANTNDECAVVAVINSVQGYWTDALAASGTSYREADTVFFNGSTSTGCGQGSSGMGPFYCPPDQMVYIDLSFWNDLKTKFGANDAPFTQAYVLAHEYGHHVQNLLGTSDRVGTATGATSGSVRLELQADCYAGVWANHATTVPDASGQVLITEITDADLQNAVQTAAAIGDDYIQTNLAGQRVDPSQFSHGTSAQRQKWLLAGYNSGDPAACNTFDTNTLGLTLPEIHLELSGADLRKVRLLPFADPIEEMIIGAHRLPLLATDPLLGGWARQTVSSLGPAGVPLLEVMNSPFVQVSDLTQTPPTAGRSFEAALDNILTAPAEKWRSEVDYLGSLGIPAGPARGLADGDEVAIANFGGALRRFHEVALRPYWTAITTYTAGGRDSLMRLLAARGIDSLLNALHPSVTWSPPVLTMDLRTACPPGCVHQMISRSIAPTDTFVAGGRGLLLLPSVFASTPTFRVPDPDEDEPFLLTVPVAADRHTFTGPASAPGSSALADLIGATRAGVLIALAKGELTTSALARTAHISVASASEHASVLRLANLITSTRQGNRVIHRLTALGTVMVESTR